MEAAEHAQDGEAGGKRGVLAEHGLDVVQKRREEVDPVQG